MNTSKLYTINELKDALLHESNEFKPKMGNNVTGDDKRNNKKAVDDIMKETGAVAKTKKEKRDTPPENIYDTNKTTLDVNFAYIPDKSYKDRVKAQAHGFPSKQNEESTDLDPSLDTDGNKEFYDEREKVSKERNELETDERHAGLKSHNMDKKLFKNKTIYTNESKKMKKLHFKNTVFLSEAQILKKIPDDYKTDGSRFIMEDSKGCQYLIECRIDENMNNFTSIEVSKLETKEQLQEKLKRMHTLYEYDSSDFNKKMGTAERINERKELTKQINNIKGIKKDVRDQTK